MKITVVTAHQQDKVLTETPQGEQEYTFLPKEEVQTAAPFADELEARGVLEMFFPNDFDLTTVHYETHNFVV